MSHFWKYSPQNPLANGPALKSWVLWGLNPSSLTMDGRKMERPEIIDPCIKAMMQLMITWGEMADRMTSLGLNSSTGVMVGLSLSRLLIMSLKIGELVCAGRCNLMKEAYSFWCSVKNRESRGVEGTMKKQIMPTRTVSNPSYTEVIEDRIVRNYNAFKDIREWRSRPILVFHQCHPCSRLLPQATRKKCWRAEGNLG